MKLTLNYHLLRREWKRYREGVPFEFLIRDASPAVLKLFERFSDVYVTFDMLNDYLNFEKLDYVTQAKLSVWSEKKLEEYGFRYLISVDIGRFENGPSIRRSILHELWHIVQHERGHDITTANVDVTGAQEYFDDPLEREAIEHEVLSAWF